MWKPLLSVIVLANLHIFISSNPHENVKYTTVTSDSSNASDVSIESEAKCATHEKYETCPDKLCEPQTCDQVGTSMCLTHIGEHSHWKGSHISSESEAESCVGPPACICIENYVRNDKGVCIPTKECTSCGNDKNATIGCGINCNRRCTNYKKKDVVCADVCYENSCDCKENYVFDDYTGNCVLPEDCSNENSDHEDNKDQIDGKGNQNKSADHNRNKSQDNHSSCHYCNIDCNKPYEWNNSEIKDSEKEKNPCSNEDLNEDDSKEEEESNEQECGCMDKDSNRSKNNCGNKSTSNNRNEISETRKTTTSIKEHWNTNKTEYTTATTESQEEPDSSSEKSETKTTSWKLNKTTTRSNFHTTAALQRNSESSEKEWTTIKTSKHKSPTIDWGTTTTIKTFEKEPTTTKMMTTSEYTKTTSTHVPNKSQKPRTTTAASSEEESFETTKESQHSGLMRCEGRHERYHHCVPSCPEYTCDDLIQHKTHTCKEKNNSLKCTPGCRCHLGHYRDTNRHCVRGIKCKKSARLASKRH